MTHRRSEWTNLSPETTDLFLDEILRQREKKKYSKKNSLLPCRWWNQIYLCIDHDIFIALVPFNHLVALQRHTHASLHPFIHHHHHRIIETFSPSLSNVVVAAIAHFSLGVCRSSFSFTNRELLCNQTRLQHVTIDANEKERVNEQGRRRKNIHGQTEECLCAANSIVFFVLESINTSVHTSRISNMSGDTELNVDTLIARLLEGNRSWKSTMDGFRWHATLCFSSSSWMSAGKDRSNDRRWSTRSLFEITRDLSQSTDSPRIGSTPEDLW